jgi:antitoxin component of MazEF toxin-antitoxin module
MPSQYTRTVIKVGNSLAVTLPKPWVDYNQLKAKDKVTVIAGDALIVKKKLNTKMLKKADVRIPEAATV